MAKMSYEELKTFVASYVSASKIAQTWSASTDNTVGLIDKIGKIITLDNPYLNKLERFVKYGMKWGKTIEEWFQDLIMPQDFDPTGSDWGEYHAPTYRPVSYHYTLGKKKIPTSIRYNDLERAVNNEEEYARLISMKSKRLDDSVKMLEYDMCKEIVAKLIALCDTAVKYSSATLYSSLTTSTAVNTIVKANASSGGIGILVKPITASSDYASWANLVSKGFVVPTDNLEEVIALPVDETTGEAFVTKLKVDVEKASDVGEGNSLNGNFLGATSGLVLLVKHGVMPNIEVQVQAGAFNGDKVAIPCEVIRVPDFGSDNTNTYAVLMDERGIALENTYQAVREDRNGDGDFLNMTRHGEYTAFISRNTFVKVYKSA